MFNSLRWTVTCQAPLSMGFSRQEFWSELPCPPPGDLPDAGIKPASLVSSASASVFFTTSGTWETELQGQADPSFIHSTSICEDSSSHRHQLNTGQLSKDRLSRLNAIGKYRPGPQGPLIADRRNPGREIEFSLLLWVKTLPTEHSSPPRAGQEASSPDRKVKK